MRTFLKKIPQNLARALRPSFAEVDYYARLILRHERRPLSALPKARREAELQLWATRAMLAASSADVPLPSTRQAAVAALSGSQAVAHGLPQLALI